MSLRICTAEYLLSDDNGLGPRQTWFPRVVSEVFLGSTKDGEIKMAPDPVTMIDGGLKWFNNSPDPQTVTVQVWRAPRSIVAQSPATVVIHDAWSWAIGKSPAAPFPSIVQDTFGGRTQVDRSSVRAEDLKYGRLFYDTDASQSWVPVGVVPPGESLHFRYLAAVQTPGTWTQPSEFEPRNEAKARWARLVAFAGAHPVDPNHGTEVYPTGIRAYGSPGVYTYRPPDWMAGHDELDTVGISPGGGGEGSRLDGHTPAGGFSGAWLTASLVYGVDFDANTEFTVTVGTGGKGGAYNSRGANGSEHRLDWLPPTGPARSVVVPSGKGGDWGAGHVHAAPIDWGTGPGPKSYRGRTYPGGADLQPGFFQSPGNYPGGGGTAGGWLQYGTAGADGSWWFNARHVA